MEFAAQFNTKPRRTCTSMAAPASKRTPVIVVSLEPDVLDLLGSHEEVEVLGFLDQSPASKDMLVPNLGTDQAWQTFRDRDPTLKAVLAIDPPRVRERLAAHYGFDRLMTVIAPSAFVSPTARVGHGSIVQRGVLVGRNARLGTAVKLNCGAQLHHDATVGDFTTVAPGARVLGNVRIGSRTYIGAEAIILPRIRIGDDSVIGAGAVVSRDVGDGAVVKGIPAR
jgi:sugar O-acyltransferase (sialic acid O-acetyltransferase NeuD family)